MKCLFILTTIDSCAHLTKVAVGKMAWRRFYLSFATVVSTVGLFSCIFVLIHEYLEYDVVFTQELTHNRMDYRMSTELDICYPQSSKLKTVDEVWSKTNEASNAVKLNHLNRYFDSKVVKFTHGHMACYSIRVSHAEYGHPFNLAWGALFEAQIDSNDTWSDEMKLYLHPPKTLLEDQFTQEITLPRVYSGHRQKLHVVLSFNFISKLLLPAPYKTRCKFYPKSRAHCLSECLNNLVKVHHCKEYRAVNTSMLERSDEILLQNANWYVTKCQKEVCRQEDCDPVLLVPKVQSVVPSLVDKVTLIPETAPGMQQVANDKISFRKIVTEILDQVVYWMAVSPIPFLVIEAMVNRMTLQNNNNKLSVK